MRSTVSVAARFAVYDDMMMSVKKNQKPPSTRPGSDLRARTEPYRMCKRMRIRIMDTVPQSTTIL